MRGYLVIGLGLLFGLTAAWAGSGDSAAPAPSARPASSAGSGQAPNGASPGPGTQPTGESKELEARRRLAAGLGPAAGVRPARPADAEARERFLAIERVARLPAAEQARILARFYRELAQRSMSAGDIIGLSSIPTNILDPTHFSGSPGNSETWGKQLAEAASNLTAEQVADKLKEGQWLNMASRARAIWVLKAHAKATEALVQEDLKSGQKQLVQRGIKTIRDLDLRTFTGQLLTLFLAEGESSEAARWALLFMRDPAIVQPLLARVEKDPKFLARCAGLFQGPLMGKPGEPLLLKLLDSPDANVRYHAGYALYECRDPNLAAPAVRFAKEKEPHFRVMAAYWASNLPADSFAAVRYDLMLLLTDGDESVRIEALRCFAQQEDLAACPVILDMLNREHPGPALKREITVMQALFALTGKSSGYDMHNWGPGTPGNQQAIRKFAAWMESRGVPVPRNFQAGEGDRPSTGTATSTSSGQATQPTAGPAEIERLIGQFSGEKFAQRVAAQQSLVKTGLPAVALLQKAAADKNPERAARAKDALSQIEESAWGQPNQGLRVRLLPLRSTWRADQAPQLSLDIRNGGRRAVECSNAVMLYCQVQVDGVWHSWAKPFALGLPIGMLAPGKEYTLKLRLTDDWGTPPGIAPGVPAKDTKWLRLAPGSHLVRVSFTGYPELGNREGGIRCESNPVQVEIEGRSAATQPATSAGSGQALSGATTQPGEGSRENGGGKWSWIGPAREATEAANWREALEKAEKYALGEPRQQEALRLYQAVLDASPPREIALHVKVIMGARLTVLYNPDLGEQSLDAEALRWCQRIIEDFKDWPNHHDLMVAKIHLGDLYYIRNDREGMGKAARLYWDVIEVPEDEIVFDDPKKANLNLDKIAVAKSSVGRQLDAKGRLLTEPTEEMNMEYREVLLSRRRESTQPLRLAAIRALAYKQGVRGDTQKTRQRLLELKQRRPDDKLYQETLDAILRRLPANAEKTAPGQGQGATSRQLLASSAPDGASTQPGAIVQLVPAGPGKRGVPQTQPGGAIPPL